MASKDDYDTSVAGTNLWWLKAAVRFVLAMSMFSIIAIVLDLIFQKYVWEPGSGVEHMEEMIQFALEHPINQEFAQKCSEIVYWVYFKWNAIDDAVVQYVSGTLPDTIMARTYRNSLIIPHHDQLAVAMYGAKLFGIRMASFVLALPLFALTCGVAVIDGLTERYIRKMGAGNESSTIYHRAKFYAFHLTPPFASLIYLSLPYSIEPALIFFPTALITGLLLRTQMKYYKKHL